MARAPRTSRGWTWYVGTLAVCLMVSAWLAGTERQVVATPVVSTLASGGQLHGWAMGSVKVGPMFLGAHCWSSVEFDVQVTQQGGVPVAASDPAVVSIVRRLVESVDARWPGHGIGSGEVWVRAPRPSDKSIGPGVLVGVAPVRVGDGLGWRAIEFVATGVAQVLGLMLGVWFVMVNVDHARRAREKQRAMAGLCVRCGYEVRRSGVEVCPECGLDVGGRNDLPL